MFPKMVGFPKSSILIHRVFHYFHHPFWGTTIFGSTPICFLGGNPSDSHEALCFSRPRLLKIVTSMLNRWGSNEKPEGAVNRRFLRFQSLNLRSL